MKRVYLKTILCISILFSLISCIKKDSNLPPYKPENCEPIINSEESSVSYATIVAVGDIMVHRWQMQRALNIKDSTYDFSHSFKYVKSILEDADFAVGNLETTFAGKNHGRNNDIYGYSCFPYFNAPEAMADELKNAGFDLFSTANNHSLDSKLSGLYTTLDILDSVGLYHVGTYRSKEESDSLSIISINDIKVGFIGCTQSLNGNRLKKSDNFSVDEFVKQDSAKIAILCEKIRKMKRKKADVVIAIVHFGSEYQLTPNRRQKQIAKAFAEAGADVILGSHPHILQNIEKYTIYKEGKEKNVIVAYSLGNFISSQIQRDSLLKDIGAILKFRLKKSQKGISIDQLSVLPTYTYWTRQEIGVVPLIKAYHNRKIYPFLTQRGVLNIKNSKQQTIEILTTSIEEKYEIDTISGFLNFELEHPIHLTP